MSNLPSRPPDPPDDVKLSQLWDALLEKGSWWVPGLALGWVAYGFVFMTMTLAAAIAGWGWGQVFFATNSIMLASVPLLAAMVWLNRGALLERIAKPTGKPDYIWAQNMEHQSRWVDALEEYRKVSEQHPLDVESLFRMAYIYRDRLDDEDQYLATLADIVRMPDDAEPAWILVEVRDRLLRLGDADPEHRPTVPRATEIELPPDDRKFGDFGPED